jgi:ABC-2 type transport system permease protein
MAALVIYLQNILRLMVKELRSLRADPIMLVLVAYTFSIAVYTVATGVKLEARDLTIGVVDEDQSEFSRSLLGAFGPPLFKVS